MTSEQFCYWLKGSIEIGDIKSFDENQVQIIKDHLDLVFKKETPERIVGGYPGTNVIVENYQNPTLLC